MEIDTVFRAAGLSPHGPVNWSDRDAKVDEKQAGVYVVAAKSRVRDWPMCPIATAQLPELQLEFEKILWVSDEEIVYIGQTTKQTLTKRIAQFRRHRYGERSPHRGGQSVHLLACELDIYWSEAEDPERSEAKMLFAFMKQGGRLPYANRDLPSTKLLIPKSEL